jgi:hypothetical protein
MALDGAVNGNRKERSGGAELNGGGPLWAPTLALAELWCVIASGPAYLVPGFTTASRHTKRFGSHPLSVTATRARSWDMRITS